MTLPAKKGDWVQIHNIVLSPEQRPENLPQETREVPLEMWVKGFLVDESAKVGDEVEIETVIGRRVKGELVMVSPGYYHDFGVPPKELLSVGKELRERLKEVGYGE